MTPGGTDFTTEVEMMSNNSLVYNRNSNGPMTEPCGTPKSS